MGRIAAMSSRLSHGCSTATPGSTTAGRIASACLRDQARLTSNRSRSPWLSGGQNCAYAGYVLLNANTDLDRMGDVSLLPEAFDLADDLVCRSG